MFLDIYRMLALWGTLHVHEIAHVGLLSGAAHAMGRLLLVSHVCHPLRAAHCTDA